MRATLAILAVIGVLTCGAAQARDALSLKAERTEVPCYETIEFTIDSDRSFERVFDPAVVQIDLEVTHASGEQWVVPAFWMQDYTRELIPGQPRQQERLVPKNAGWRARFAPLKPGKHSVRARLLAGASSRREVSEALAFEAHAPRRPGYLRVSSKDSRFFEFSSGQPFFAVGQNLAFIGNQQHVTLGRAEEIFRKFAENGVNYVRVWTCCEDWALCLEGTKKRGEKLKQRGHYNQEDGFMLDALVRAAEENGIYLQLCLLTRDLYMPHLKDPESAAYAQCIADAQNFMRYAVARWGASTAVAAWEYWNEMDPGLPTSRFHAALAGYLDHADMYRHLRSTSTWGPSERDCRDPALDFADGHFYLRPVDAQRLQDEVQAVQDRAQWLRTHAPGKPAILGEFSIADDKWRLRPEMTRTTNTVDVHNIIWASALSGLSGTGMAWWWERLDQRHVYPVYRTLATFVKDIPWTTGLLKEADLTTPDPGVRVLGLVGADGRAWGWVFHKEAAWAKVQDGPLPAAKPVKLQLKGLLNREYQVEWVDTRQGHVVRTDAGRGPDLELTTPEFKGDVALRLRLE